MNKRLIALLFGLTLFVFGVARDQFGGVPRAEYLSDRQDGAVHSVDIEAHAYPVSRVIDGDTIDVRTEGGSVRLRLLGMNTPETVDPRKKVECFGKEAAVRAKELLEGISVRLKTDPSQGLYDHYGRMLAYVYLPDGRSFNELMIEEGYAYEYTYRTPYRLQSQFKSAEKRARLGVRGLWAPGVCGVK